MTQWTDNSSTAALTNTLAALTLAGVPATNTTIDEVLVSLRKLVIVSDAPAEAEVEFTMRPRIFLCPRLYAVPRGSGQYGVLAAGTDQRAAFEVYV